MVLDLVLTKTDDGISAEIPSIQGCECWAPEEDAAIEKALELLCYYINLPFPKQIKIDRARIVDNVIIYKLIFDK